MKKIQTIPGGRGGELTPFEPGERRVGRPRRRRKTGSCVTANLVAKCLSWVQPLPSQDFCATAALRRRGWHGRKVPLADIDLLFDHFVAAKQRERHIDT